MPELMRPDGTVIHYETAGSGPALLALAPGGMASTKARWSTIDLDLSALEQRFQVIHLDQRYAGASRTGFVAYSYDVATADQLAVLDALGVTRAFVLGSEFGAVQAMKLAYDAPARVKAVCVHQPIGRCEANTMNTYYQVFNETIRLARAEGLQAVVDLAVTHACFTDCPGAGPWAARLNAEPLFRAAALTLGRETYITLVVDCRDGLLPMDRIYFALNDLAVARIEAPTLVVPGNTTYQPAAVASGLGQMLRSGIFSECVDAGDLIAFFESHTDA